MEVVMPILKLEQIKNKMSVSLGNIRVKWENMFEHGWADPLTISLL